MLYKINPHVDVRHQVAVPDPKRVVQPLRLQLAQQLLDSMAPRRNRARHRDDSGKIDTCCVVVV